MTESLAGGGDRCDAEYGAAAARRDGIMMLASAGSAASFRGSGSGLPGSASAGAARAVLPSKFNDRRGTGPGDVESTGRDYSESLVRR